MSLGQSIHFFQSYIRNSYTGHANIQRLNGELARNFRMRLQTRLGQLAALDAHIVSEVETIRGKMQHTKQQLRDIELKRMEIDLQVNMFFVVIHTKIFFQRRLLFFSLLFLIRIATDFSVRENPDRE